MSWGKPLSFSHSESSNVSIFCNLQMEFGSFCMLGCLDKNRYLKWLKLPVELSNLIFESSTTQINLAPAGTWISWWMFTTNVCWWFPYLLDLVIEWSTISLVGVRINSGTNCISSSTSRPASEIDMRQTFLWGSEIRRGAKIYRWALYLCHRDVQVMELDHAFQRL